MLKQAFPSWLFLYIYNSGCWYQNPVISNGCSLWMQNQSRPHLLIDRYVIPATHTQEDYNSLTYFCTKNKPVPFFLYKWTGSVWVPWWFSGENCPLEERKFAVWIQQLPFLCGACVLSKVLHVRSFLKWIYDSWDRLHANVTLNWINH